MDEQLKMFKELTEINGISGYEKQVRDVMKRYVEGYADEICTDNLGSLIAKKVGDEAGPKIMITGHMDEIGFIVTSVDDDGFVYFQPIGGWGGRVMLSQKVTITTSSGRECRGVIQAKIDDYVQSLRLNDTKFLDMNNMYIDLGVSSKDEVDELGIKCGDMVTPFAELEVMNNPKYLMAKAWDDRIGVALCIDVLKALKDEKHPNVLYAVGTVQEEVGLRGAKTATNKISPNIGISLDVGLNNDTPGSNKKPGSAKLGCGPEIIVKDSLMVGHSDLRNFVVGICDEVGIGYQLCALGQGASDTGAIHLAYDGVPSISIGLPVRYVHTHLGIMHRDDYDNTVRLVVEFVKRLDMKCYNEILIGE